MVASLKLSAQDSEFPFLWKQWGLNWQALDTTLNVQQLFAQEPLRSDWFGILPLGNQGSWRQELIFYRQPEITSHFGNRAFDLHFRDFDQWTYYNVKTPLTEADYRQGYARGQLFRIFHTQNVNERLNFFFDFSRLNSLGPYQNQQVEQSDVLLTMHYTTKNGLYSFNGGFNTAFIKAEANGGLFYDSVFSDNTILDRELIQVNSLNGQHYLRNRSALFDQSYRLINNEKDSTCTGWLQRLQINHRFTYKRQSLVYTDIPGDNTPDPILQSFVTNDSTAFERVENSLGVSAEGAINFRADIWLASSSNEGVNYRTVQNHTGLRASFSTLISNSFPITANLNYIIQGARQGGLDIYAETGFTNGSIEFLPYTHLTSAFPGFQEYRYTSNYKAWNQSYDIMTRTEFGLKVRQKFIGQLQLRAFQWTAPVYYDSLAFPVQSTGSSGYVSLEWKSQYKWWIFHLDNRVIWQISEENDPFVQVPDLYFRETLYSQFSLFNNAIRLQPGLSFTFLSKYQMPAYDPYANVFHRQTDGNYGGFPLIDAFVNVKIGRARFFFELEHFNYFLGSTNYWAAPGYPLPDMQFRVGINWRFFN